MGISVTPGGVTSVDGLTGDVDLSGSYAPLASALSWGLVVDESGASIANWTSVAGTWSADAGGFLKQTDTTAAYRGLRLTANVEPGAGMVAQAEIRFPTAATADRRAMLSIAGSGTVSAISDPWAGLGENVDQAWFHRGDQSTATQALTVNEDQWYTVRVAQVGFTMTLWVDGSLVTAKRIVPAAATIYAADKFMLVNYTGEVHFRNIKVWRLSAPA